MKTLLDQQQLDVTGGILYIYQVENQYIITIENKITNFYEELLHTKSKPLALMAFEQVYQSSADDIFKPKRVSPKSVISSWVRTSIDQ